MLNEKQKSDLEKLTILRKEVELLDSHVKVFQEGEELVHITPKQYAESGSRILEHLTEIEHEYGIYEDNSINRSFKAIRKTIDEIERELTEMLTGINEELYNLEIQNTIDEIIEENYGHSD